MRDFSHRGGAALVVGATGGIGQAIARMLAERGCRVALTFRANGDTAAALTAAIGEPARAWQLDLTDETACARVVEEVAQAFGGIHTLCHAAGPHVPMVHLSRVSPSQFRSQMENDAIGFFNVLAPALPHLRASQGSIVAVTTAATDRIAIRDGLSLTPKGAVEALVRGIAAEEGRFGVRANIVGPGMLTDGMAQRLIDSGDLDDTALAAATKNIPMRRFGHADDIAEVVCFLASDRAGYISGQKVNVDGGYTA
jgi:NAD(P)-dependent dehydrogenase (short-subunit alcohol dehydrogenase family)